jgi:hypothetical protein
MLHTSRTDKFDFLEDLAAASVDPEWDEVSGPIWDDTLRAKIYGAGTDPDNLTNEA